jgi:hypothetical protein
MANLALSDFIDTNRDELIGRCRAKVAARSSPPPTDAEITHGVPLFLEQLVAELRRGVSKTHEISKGAQQHGHELLRLGFTVSQVVHNYGDVCQAVTDLAVELATPISPDDFRTLNRCLDDAIASAVSQHAHEQKDTRDVALSELEQLTDRAIMAFEVLQSGRVGVAGTTGAVVLHNLHRIRALIGRPAAVLTDPQPR